MTHDLLTLDWWTAAGQRAAYTALAALLPLAALLIAGDVDVLYVLLVVALALLASLATSLAGLPEVTGRDTSPWIAVLVRVTKTSAQTLAANLVGSVVLTDVDWHITGTAVAGAALTTLVRTLMAYLPETPTGAAEFGEFELAAPALSAAERTHLEQLHAALADDSTPDDPAVTALGKILT
ncbi:hypothetical protein [Cellulomonas gilvus]|uniref:Uncharacterized protein n=1 Tax=Cellulomonas gilvus (strain ATCC 13127 / NRRL B-14078) TaxID=593907 RepID=F8A2E6_CELGA|nr:hypothetical protein [Cellulomonas gilvus]AEI11803.1 hypothetical protein Celgi_1284 [Cellulomonas gilvus ATCC 13127]